MVKKSSGVVSLRSQYDKEQVLIDIRDCLNRGDSGQDIQDFIHKKYPNIGGGPEKIKRLITEVRGIIVKELDLNIQDVMIKHSNRYENIYARNREPKDKDGNKITDRSILVGYYLTAMDALKRKEKLLGVVQKNQMDVQLNNEVTEEINHEDALHPKDVDFSKLTIEEKKEMLLLLKKSKGEELQQHISIQTIVSVTTEQEEEPPKYDKDVVDQIEVEDVDYEEVKDRRTIIGVAKKVKDSILQQAIDNEKKLKKQKLLFKLKNKQQ